MGSISEQQQPYPCFREHGCYCLVLFCFFLLKPLTLKTKGLGHSVPFTGVLNRISLLSGSASLPGSNHKKPGQGRRATAIPSLQKTRAHMRSGPEAKVQRIHKVDSWV